ncbi:MAG: preprotein translocase subunit SecE [Chloroflexi bacterium]|nr:preprotein translocase subunit SecE [Chloroflexota bacterium]
MSKAEKSKEIEVRKPNKLQTFFRETIGELKKVSWPTRQEAWKMTKVVLAVVVVVGILLGVLDFLYSQFFALILS